MVELLQVRRRHAHVAHHCGLLQWGQRRRRVLALTAADACQNRFHIKAGGAAALLDGPLHGAEWMLVEQVQDTHVVLDAAARAVLPLQGGAQLLEDGRQLPAAKDLGMVQRRRPTPQRVQVVPRLDDLFVAPIRARVAGDDLALTNHVEALDVDLDGHGLEGGAARHAVAVGVEADHLVLVHLGRLHEARIEGIRGQ